MDRKKTYAMFSLIWLVLSGAIVFDPSEAPSSLRTQERDGEAQLDLLDLHLGPQYNGNTLHVGAGQTYATIQAAQDASVDGDTIVVHPGKYVENVVIDTSVHMNGMKGAIIEGSGAIGIRVLSGNVTITGMQVNNSNNGIYATAMGLNVSDCVLYRNTMEIRIEVINSTLTKDFLGYPIVLMNNTIDHSSTSNMIDITLTFSAAWASVNISVGAIMVTKTKITNIPNRGYDVRVRETVSQVSAATLTIGDVITTKNNFTLMDYGISVARTVSDMNDMEVSMGDLLVEENRITNPRTLGVQMTNVLSRWTGSSSGTVGAMYVRNSRIVSSSVSSSGITFNPVQFSQCADNARLEVGDINVSSNFLNVSSRGIYLNTNQPMGTCIGNASLTFGNITVWNNTIISRFSVGINYVMSTLSLSVNTSARFGHVTLLWNKVSAPLNQGITVSLTDITSSMSGNARFDHGGFEIRGNDLTSSSYGCYFNFIRVGKGATGSSRFSMGGILVEGNSISGSNGVRVMISDSLTSAGGLSQASMGDVMVRSNTIKSTSPSVYMSLTTICSHTSGDSSAIMGRISVNDNTVLSNNDGVYLIMDTICFDQKDRTISRFDGLSIYGNVLSTATYGMNLVRVRYVGENLYDNTSVDLGEVTISGNELTKGTGINIGQISYMGYYLADNSTFDFGGLKVEGNRVNSTATGLAIGQVTFIGNDLFGQARSTVGVLSIDSNQVNSTGNGITISSMNMLSSSILGGSSSEMGPISISGNSVSSGGVGINLATFGEIGYYLTGSSQAKVSGLSIDGNVVTSKGIGINLGTVFRIATTLSDSSLSSVGVLSVSNNSMSSGSHGIYLETYQDIGTGITGLSNSSVGGLRVSNNTILSEGLGIFTGTIRSIGTGNMDKGRTEIGDISYDYNAIVSNATGMNIGYIGQIGLDCWGNSTVVFGRIGADHNMVTSNGSGILVMDEMELSFRFYDYVTAYYEGITFNGNDLMTKKIGLSVPEVRLGLQMWGRSKSTIGIISASGNRISSRGGLVFGLNVTEHQGNSTLTIGSLDLDGNVIEGSEGNGIALDLSFWTLENSTFTMGHQSISDNRLIDVNWSGIMVSRRMNFSEDSTFTLGGLDLVHNNLTRCSLGLNLTGCGNVGAYLNNFIGNEADVSSDEGTSVTWYSPEKMWYRHKFANHSYYLGNYWDHYTGTDTDDNGIGDVPYDTGFGLDLYPLTSNVDDHFPPWNDVTPPSVTILFPTNGSYLRQTEFTLSYSVSDNLQGFREISLMVDGHLVGGRANRDLSDPDTVIRMSITASEGVHTIEIRAVDMAGNENSTSSTFMVDVTPPSLTLVSPQDGSSLDVNDIELVWLGSDIPSGLERFEVKFGSWDWTDVGTARNHTFPDVSEGEHLVQVRAWDRAGNNRTISVHLYVDTIAPLLTLLNPVQDGYYNTSNIEVRWEVADMSDVEASLDLDGTGFLPLDGSTEHLLEGLVHGKHTITLKVTDASLHTVQTQVSFMIDLRDPVVSVISPGRYVRSTDLTVVLKANGTGSPLDQSSIRLDDGLWTDIDPHYGPDDTLELDLYGLDECDHVIHLVIPDMAGNRWFGDIVITVDMTSPAVLSALPLGNGVRTDIHVFVELSEVLRAEGFSFEIRPEGTGTDPIGGALTWNGSTMTFVPEERLSPSTRYSIRVEGTDLAMNGFVHSWGFETASKGTILGRVLDEEGAPVSGAFVSLDTGETAMTGGDGLFSIKAPQGNRTVTISFKGKVLDIFYADVTAGVDHDVGDRTVTLPKGKDEQKDHFPWQLFVLIAVIVVLLLLLGLYLLLGRKGKDTEEDIEWDIEEEEEWGVPSEE